VGPKGDELINIIQKMEATGLKLTVEDGLDDFLGVKIHEEQDGTIQLKQLHLTDSILCEL
jgi:hypothetical protein